jgi:excisionase family DNA binding protein
MPASDTSGPSQPASSQRDDGPVLHSISTLAARWGVCERTIRRLVGRGKLKAHWIGGQIRIAEEEEKAFLQSNIVSGPTPKNSSM